MMHKCSLEINNISKKYHGNFLFSGLSRKLETGQSIAVTGHNGSGKSTLLQIISGLKKPTAGKIEYAMNGLKIPPEEIFNHIGFAAPIVNPYDDLTGIENIQFSDKHDAGTPELLDELGLAPHRHKPVKLYSSGMKQRLKYILAVLNSPPVLLLDEPGMNLDRDGKEMIYSHIRSLKRDRIIIIATNESEEAGLCDGEIRVG